LKIKTHKNFLSDALFMLLSLIFYRINLIRVNNNYHLKYSVIHAYSVINSNNYTDIRELGTSRRNEIE